MNRIFSLLILFSCLISFGQNTQENSQLFRSKIKANVTKNDTINLDNFKELVIIPGGHFRKELEKINYFSKIMTFEEFQKEVKKAGFDVSKYNINTKEGAEFIFKDYKKFIFVAQTRSSTDEDTRQIIIVDPTKGKVFEVEGKLKTNVVGISAGSTYMPEEINNAMLNELVNYIRTNSKAYK